MKLTGSNVEAMRIELGDEAVEAMVRCPATLPEPLIKQAFVTGFEHGADGEKPRLEGPGVSADEVLAFRAGIVEGATARRSGLLAEVTAAGFRQSVAEDEYEAWRQLEAGEV